MKGELYALASAFTWGCAVVLFKRGGEQMGPVVLNLFKNLVALLLLSITLLFLGDFMAPFALLSPRELWLLGLSGGLGIAVADTLLFASLNRIGVTRIAIVDCLYSPCILLFSWYLVNESLFLAHYIGGTLILVGILISGWRRKKKYQVEEHSGTELWFGMLLGVCAIVVMTFSIVLVKPILQKVPLAWATTFRLTVGSVLLFVWLLVTRRSDLSQLIRPTSGWRFIIPAACLGTYISMLFWIGGFKYAKASTAGLINQSSIIFAILLSALFLKEPLTRPKLIAILFAASGVLVVSFGA